MIKLLAGALLPAMFLGGAYAVDYLPPESLAAVPVPSGAVCENAAGGSCPESGKDVSSGTYVYRVPMTVDASADFYKNIFAPALMNYDGDMPVYEEMEEGTVSGVIYFPVYYCGGKALKSASFSWGGRFKDGWRVFEVRVSEAVSGGESRVEISEAAYGDAKSPGGDEGVSALYKIKLKEFEKMAGRKVFLGVPKYPNSVFLPERSAAMTSENMGRDTFVFASMDDAVIAADFYAGLPGFRQLEAEDEMFIFRFAKDGGEVSVAVTGKAAEGEPDLITEITLIDMTPR